MSCFKSKSKSNLPSYITTPSAKLSTAITGQIGKPFVPYTKPMVAGMNSTQMDANAGLKDLAGSGPLPRLIDDIPGGLPGGKSGSTADYMDPYLRQVLDPVLRQLGITNKENLMGVDASANMAGAFGDTGHALERSETNQRGTQAIGDATGQAYSAAFNNAMALKGQDINRIGADKAQKGNMLSQIFGEGTTQQETEQKGMNADFAEFLRKQGWDTDSLAKISAIIGNLQAGTTTTTPSTASTILGGALGIGSLF